MNHCIDRSVYACPVFVIWSARTRKAWRDTAAHLIGSDDRRDGSLDARMKCCSVFVTRTMRRVVRRVLCVASVQILVPAFLALPLGFFRAVFGIVIRFVVLGRRRLPGARFEVLPLVFPRALTARAARLEQ
jgi:hypothetical protein